MRDGYSFKSENNGCSIYMSNIFYGHAPLRSGLFILNLDSSDTHIHNVEAKRCRVDNDSATYLWHCRLGHIGIKRMKKLHADGILESLDACEPCLMGDTSILHHDFISIFIALWVVITHYVPILMPFLSYFTRFT